LTECFYSILKIPILTFDMKRELLSQ